MKFRKKVPAKTVEATTKVAEYRAVTLRFKTLTTPSVINIKARDRDDGSSVVEESWGPDEKQLAAAVEAYLKKKTGVTDKDRVIDVKPKARKRYDRKENKVVEK